MNTTRIRIPAAALLAALLAGCGGGGGTTPAQPAAPPQSLSRVPASAVATIVIPPKGPVASSSDRRPMWVSPSTSAIQINAKRLSDGFTDSIVQALTPTTSGCSAQPNGSTLCLVPFAAPPTTGSDLDDITIYVLDSTNYSQAFNLGFLETQQPVSATQVNNFTFVIGGVPDRIAYTATPPSVTAATVADIALKITPQDADLNPINGAFDSPVLASVTGTAATHFTITAPAASGGVLSIADPTKLPVNGITVHYDGLATKGQSAVVIFQTNSTAEQQNHGGTLPRTVGSITIPVN